MLNKIRQLFKDGLNFKQVMLLIFIAILVLYLIKTIFKVSCFAILKLFIPLLMIGWAATKLKEELERRNGGNHGR